MNRQDTYNRVKTHLLAQNARALAIDPNSPHNRCVYRAPNGHKCNIGYLIPDELYDPKMEGKGVTMLFMDFPETMTTIFGNTTYEDETFLSRLQLVHDQNEPHAFGGALMTFACDYDLDP